MDYNIKNNNLETTKDNIKEDEINIYKTLSSKNTENVNKINIENENNNNIESNKLLTLSKNKARKKQGKLNYLQGRINAPSLDFKNLKYQEEDILPSSNRNLENETEKENYFGGLENYGSINKKNAIYNDNDDNDINYNEFYNEFGFNEKGKEGEDIINPKDLFKKIINLDLNIKISNEELKLFLFNEIPKGETLISNININFNDKLENNITFNYNLELFRNNKIYYFAKIVKYFPQMKIRIYYSDNYNNINNCRYSQISNENKKIDSNLIYVGKIISNMMRTNFVVYSGNKKNNYLKILDINYSINFFGLLGIREMKVNKYKNNIIIFSFHNSKPEWDFQYNNYKMNFNGRVKQTSKKNFILVENINNKNKNEENINVLQCGKIKENTYSLDFISPLSTFDAFCISITSLVTKISCE